VSATHPRWTLLGTLATPARGLVDARGCVSSTPGWALDWWVGAEDRWHLARQEASVRQHLVDDTPVVETAMHVPGGDVVHRAYAVRDRGPTGADADLLVVEIENRSAVPVALALVVGPFDPYAPAPGGDPGTAPSGGSVSSLTLDAGPERSVLRVDGRPGLLLAKPPARATSVLAGGDLEAAVTGGLAPRGLDPVSCPDGGARGALIYPLAHTATLRVVLPLDSPAAASAGIRRGRARAVSFPTAVTSGEQVAKGWEVQTRRPMSVSLPDPRWTAVTQANRAFLLLGAGDAESWARAVDTIGALDRWGFHDEAARLLRHASDPGRDSRPVDAATLVALADHLALTGDRALVEELAVVVALGVGRADRPRRRSRRADRSEHLDDPVSARSVEWRARGLAAAVALLEAIDQPEAAVAVAERARRLDSQRRAPAIVGPGPVAPAEWPGAWSPAETLRQAAAALAVRAELAAGAEPAGSAGEVRDRAAWALSVIGPTQVWPEAVDPDRPSEALGLGHDPVAGAAWLRFVRTMLVSEAGSADAPTLGLCTWWPIDWRGQGLEVHHAPTAYGELSYAVRWHGERPALLWELVAGAGRPATEPAEVPVTLRAPGLDPTWSTREPRGEALLAPVADGRPPPEMPGAEPPDQGASFS
jgi:hypothetical protein